MRTFGVEEELLLIDEGSGAPLAASRQLLTLYGSTRSESAPEMTAEMQQEMIEVITRPCGSASELSEAIRAGRAATDEAAQEVGARAVALATSPLAVQPHATPKDRYRTMMERYGVTARSSLACGYHVHVAVESPEEGVAILDRIRTWLPVILALSSNSPFADGGDTGYASYRTAAWRQWPCAGPTDVFGSLEAYRAFEQQLLATGVLLDDGMLYLDARLSRNHPTVEIRVADVCLTQSAAVTIATLCRALAETAAREYATGVPPAALCGSALRLASWQASLCGIRGSLVNPVTGVPEPAHAVIRELLDHVRDALTYAGDLEVARRGVQRIMSEGTGAEWQRSVFADTRRLDDVVIRAVTETHATGFSSPSRRRPKTEIVGARRSREHVSAPTV